MFVLVVGGVLLVGRLAGVSSQMETVDRAKAIYGIVANRAGRIDIDDWMFGPNYTTVGGVDDVVRCRHHDNGIVCRSYG